MWMADALIDAALRESAQAVRSERVAPAEREVRAAPARRPRAAAERARA